LLRQNVFKHSRSSPIGGLTCNLTFISAYSTSTPQLSGSCLCSCIYASPLACYSLWRAANALQSETAKIDELTHCSNATVCAAGISSWHTILLLWEEASSLKHSAPSSGQWTADLGQVCLNLMSEKSRGPGYSL